MKLHLHLILTKYKIFLGKGCLVCEPNIVHDLHGTLFGPYVRCFDFHASLWTRILEASEAILAAVFAQIPQNFSHIYFFLYVF